MNSFEKKLTAQLKGIEDFSGITPGVVIDVHVKGNRKGLIRFGKTYPYYDLASLTKILFTGSLGILHLEDFPYDLKRPIVKTLPWWNSRKTTPFQLLTHTAGLDWWKPMYKSLKGSLNPNLRWEQLEQKLHRLRPKRTSKAVYSDLDIWMMGAFYSTRREQSLLEMWYGIEERLEIEKLFFHPENKPLFARAKYAPTERCEWRRKVLRGEVHDENAWALGGVAPHAGLFGSVEGVSDWGNELRLGFLGKSRRFRDQKIVRQFVKRQIPREVGDWGLGFMKPTKGGASCGKHFSLDSFGHTGFTGTSYWYDPKQDLQVVILSNRVHPTRENKKFVALRPVLHDWICEAL